MESIHDTTTGHDTPAPFPGPYPTLDAAANLADELDAVPEPVEPDASGDDSTELPFATARVRDIAGEIVTVPIIT